MSFWLESYCDNEVRKGTVSPQSFHFTSDTDRYTNHMVAKFNRHESRKRMTEKNKLKLLAPTDIF